MSPLKLCTVEPCSNEFTRLRAIDRNRHQIFAPDDVAIINCRHLPVQFFVHPNAIQLLGYVGQDTCFGTALLRGTSDFEMPG